MRFQSHINESSNVTDLISRLLQMGYNKAQKELEGSTKKLLQLLMDKGMSDEAILIINKHLKTNFKSLKDLGKKHRLAIRGGIHEEGQLLNEDFKHLWNFMGEQIWGGLAFYPILQLFFELDKLLAGTGVDMKRTAVYAAVFLFIMSAKHLQMFKKWKREKPAEWEMEGRPGAFFGKKGLSADAKKYMKQSQGDPTATRTSGRLGFALKK